MFNYDIKLKNTYMRGDKVSLKIDDYSDVLQMAVNEEVSIVLNLDEVTEILKRIDDARDVLKRRDR